MPFHHEIPRVLKHCATGHPFFAWCGVEVKQGECVEGLGLRLGHLSYRLNSLQRVLWGITLGITLGRIMRVAKGNTRSLDPIP